MYRHLLFNRLSGDNDKFDVPSPSISKIQLTLLAFHPPSQHSAPPLWCLLNLGTHRENRCPRLLTLLFLPRSLFSRSAYQCRVAASTAPHTTIFILPVTCLCVNALVPSSDSAVVFFQSIQPTRAGKEAIYTFRVALSASYAAIDCVVSVKLQQVVSDTSDHLGLWFKV